MIKDEDIIRNPEEVAANTPDGEKYSLQYVLFIENNNLPIYEADILKVISVTYDFKSLLKESDTIECVNDDCSVVRFLDKNGNELETLSTTAEFGYLLSSNARKKYIRGKGPCNASQPCNG